MSDAVRPSSGGENELERGACLLDFCRPKLPGECLRHQPPERNANRDPPSHLHRAWKCRHRGQHETPAQLRCGAPCHILCCHEQELGDVWVVEAHFQFSISNKQPPSPGSLPTNALRKQSTNVRISICRGTAGLNSNSSLGMGRLPCLSEFPMRLLVLGGEGHACQLVSCPRHVSLLFPALGCPATPLLLVQNWMCLDSL